MKPTSEQVAAFATADLDEPTLALVMSKATPPPLPPSPHDIALRLAAALLSSNRFGDDAAAAVETAWTLVIPYYQGQLVYERQGRNLFNIAQHAGAPEPDMTQAEARAYLAPGGETGRIGEATAGGDELATVKLTGSQTIDTAAVTARWQRIEATTKAVIAAQATLEEARAMRDAVPAGKRHAARYQAADHAVDEALAAFNKAAAEQSAAYE